jgi:hypothetical protein
MISNLRSSFSLLFMVLFLVVGCGKKKSWVKEIQFKQEVVEGQVLINVKGNLSIGNINLPNVKFPIENPQTNTTLGYLSLINVGSSKSIEVTLNISELIHLNTAIVKLPNGETLPLLGENQVIELAVGPNKNIKVYFSFNQTQLALGLAVPIKTLDTLGSKVGTTSFFPTFNVSKVFGAIGIFTSQQIGQNGLGFFMDLSLIMPQESMANMYSGELEKINYNEITPDRTDKAIIEQELLKMHERSTQLKL